MGIKVSEDSHGNQTHCNSTYPDLYLLSTELPYLSCDDFRRKGVSRSKVLFCFFFTCTALDLREIWLRKWSFPTSGKKMQPSGSQHKNKHWHVWNTMPAIIKTHKQLQNNSVSGFTAWNLQTFRNGLTEKSAREFHQKPAIPWMN